MAKLSNEEWQEARQLWERTDSLTFEELSKALPVSRQGISKRAHQEQWCKNSGRKLQSNKIKKISQQRNENIKVAHHQKIAIDALIEVVNDSNTPKKLVIAACAELLKA